MDGKVVVPNSSEDPQQVLINCIDRAVRYACSESVGPGELLLTAYALQAICILGAHSKGGGTLEDKAFDPKINKMMILGFMTGTTGEYLLSKDKEIVSAQRAFQVKQ